MSTAAQGASAPTPAAGAADRTAVVAARLERLPASRWQVTVRLLIGAVTFFEAFDQLLTAYTLPDLRAAWHLGGDGATALITIGSIGMLVGALCSGRLADRFGRVRIVFVCLLVSGLGNLALAACGGPVPFQIVRFVQGMAIGGQVPVAAAYIAEITRSHGRGRFVLLYELVFPAGLTVGSFVAAWVIPAWGWRGLYLLAAVPLVLAIPVARYVPESPRWLAGRGRADDAERTMADIERKVTALTGRPLPEPQVREISPEAATAGARRLGFAALFQGRLRRRTLVVCALWFLGYFAQYGVSTWLPTIYQTGYHLPKSQALNYATMTSLAGFVGCLVAALTVDRIGRRWVTAAGLFLGGLTLLVLALTGSDSADQVVLWTSIAMVFNFACNISLYVYTPELYPTGARALGTSVGGAANRIGVILGPLIVGLVYTGGTGTAGVFALLGCAALLGSVVSGVFAEETTGRTLEEASA
ncbi:MFS transporter [Phaeacidiphilus oryzae]|uniref:MFS transporter n=1 Tax=Phaeacidiphilus oryzae TaxID=348818 RepID=UPI00055C5677|nr:MFS transporter [Phaeacidiphilus oryzae]